MRGMNHAWCPILHIGTVALLPLSFTSPHNFLQISWPNFPHLNAVMEPIISITAPTPTDFKPNSMGAYTGLLPSSPTQPCLTWYAVGGSC